MSQQTIALRLDAIAKALFCMRLILTLTVKLSYFRFDGILFGRPSGSKYESMYAGFTRFFLRDDCTV
jgi:hypothetical protein